MQTNNELIPHLYRTEYRKLTAVLCKLFGIEHLEIAEDIVSDTFLLATNTWGLKGLPENPVAWLYTVAKNKTKDYLKRNTLFTEKVSAGIRHSLENSASDEIEIDLSAENINDSQLQMMFAVCNPCISPEAQIGLSLNILCGFGAEEIADAFLSNREVIYKRLARAKEKLRSEGVKIELPSEKEISGRLENVLTILYLLFSEGYYSVSQNATLRKDLCLEAMRLTYLLIENKQTNKAFVNALMSLMCFQASRFEARTGANGEIILYDDQDASLWDPELIDQGKYFLQQAAKGDEITKYHLEAAIAFEHTVKEDTPEKWETILQLYNKLLQIEYSPVVALNRTYALSKANGKEEAIGEAEKLNLQGNHLYYLLLGELYSGLEPDEALKNLRNAFKLARTASDKAMISKKISALDVTN
jgi:RNA polymerase sigma factor (sigma-70 family)